MRGKPIFKNVEYLYESNFASLTKREQKDCDFLKERILADIKGGKSEIVAYLGPNGSGKSTVLKESLEIALKEYRVRPVFYEIWQYQNEEKMWENFLISILSKTNRPGSKNKVAKRIKNGTIRKWFILVQVIICLIVLYFSFHFIPVNIDDGRQYVNVGNLILAVSSFGFFGVILTQFYRTGGIEYVYQYEDKLLKKLKKKSKKPIVLVIEDVDRTQNGERIIESLHSFINTNREKIKTSIIAICPMSRDSFYGAKTENRKDRLKRIELSNKIYDYAINSSLAGNVTENDIDEILNQIGCEDDRIKPIFISLLAASNRSASLFNMRAIKFILRDVHQFIERYPTLDGGVAILFASAKYIATKIDGTSNSDDAIRTALLNPNGTTINRLYANTAYSKVFGEVFDIVSLMEENKISTSNFSTPLRFVYTANGSPHSITLSDDKKFISIQLSGHYKELL